MNEKFSEIDEIINTIHELLQSETIISEDLFFPLVGRFSKALNLILSQYFTLNESEQHEWAPYINYYRQLQGYLVFILRFPTILLVPHHSEIQQTLDFIVRKDSLIHEFYTQYSEENRQLLHGHFKEYLEKIYGQKRTN